MIIIIKILILKLPADLELTLQSTAEVENDQFPPKPPSYSSLFPVSRSVLFEHPQFGLPILLSSIFRNQ